MKTLHILLLCSIMPCLHGVCKKQKVMAGSDNNHRKHNTFYDRHNKTLLLVEQKFLNFMGLIDKPERGLKERIKVPDYLWKLYYKWSDENFEDEHKNHADTARVIYHDVQKDHVTRSVLSGLRFNLTEIGTNENIQSAELHVYNQGGSSPTKKTKLLKIMIPNHKINNTKDIVASKRLRAHKVGYIRLDVTKAVKSWNNNTVDPLIEFHFADGENNIEEHNIHYRQRRHVRDTEWNQKRPLLVVYTSSGISSPKKRSAKKVAKHSRKKRSTIDRAININLTETQLRLRREVCRLHGYHLKFADVGWNDWILAPSGFPINYCSGECPRPLGPHFNTTNHAVIQNTVASLKKNMVPSLCCIPTTLRDQTFLYMNSLGKVALKQPSDTIALACGCH